MTPDEQVKQAACGRGKEARGQLADCRPNFGRGPGRIERFLAAYRFEELAAEELDRAAGLG